MKFTHYNLGVLSGGETVIVSLEGQAANVLLMDSSNFSAFRQNGKYNYYGGYVERSPFRIGVPHSGHWFVIVNLGGYAGSVRSSVRVA